MLNKTLLKPYNIITIKFYTFDTLKLLGTINYSQSNLPDLPISGDRCFLNNKKYTIIRWSPECLKKEKRVTLFYYIKAEEE